MMWLPNLIEIDWCLCDKILTIFHRVIQSLRRGTIFETRCIVIQQVVVDGDCEQTTVTAVPDCDGIEVDFASGSTWTCRRLTTVRRSRW